MSEQEQCAEIAPRNEIQALICQWCLPALFLLLCCVNMHEDLGGIKIAEVSILPLRFPSAQKKALMGLL